MEFIKRANLKSARSEYTSIEIFPERTYVDTLRSRTRTERIWGSEVNPIPLIKWLANHDIKTGLELFFASNSVELVIRSLIPQAQMRTSDVLFTQAELAKAVRVRVVNPDLVSAIVELLCPMFCKLGTMTSYNTYSVVIDYPNKPVSVSDLKAEIDAALVVERLGKVIKTIVEDSRFIDKRVSSRVFAQAVSFAYRQISSVLIQTQDLSAVMDDIVKGVRMHLDPTGVVGKTLGSPQPAWYNGDIVSYFARNVVFIKEALSYGSEYNLTPTSEISQLEKWGGVIRTSIDTSYRFKEISLKEVRDSYYHTHIRNINGEIKASVLTRAEVLTPMSQAIYKAKDQMAEEGMFVMGVKDRSAEATISSYPTYSGGLSQFIHTIASSVALDLVESGAYVEELIFYPGAVCDFTLTDIAMAFATRIYVESDDSGFVGTLFSSGGLVVPGAGPQAIKIKEESDEWQPSFIYSIDTEVPLNLKVTSGTHLGTEITTRDPVEVLLCGADRNDPVSYSVTEQLLGPQSFNASIMNVVDLKKRLVPLNSRMDYKLKIGSLVLQAAIQPINFASLKSSKDLDLVSPMYNKQQIESGLQSLVELNKKLLSDWKAEIKDKKELVDMIQRTLAVHILKFAQSIPRSFRDEFHDVFINKSIVSLKTTTENVETYRTRAMQGPVKAAMDCLALSMFCALLGVKNNDFSKMLTGADLPGMIRAYTDVGSDRNISK